MVLNAQQLLDREFLEVRCRLLDIASALDRIDRADGAGTARADPRMAKLVEGVRLLTDALPDRAERLQRLFSLEYESGWRDRESGAE